MGDRAATTTEQPVIVGLSGGVDSSVAALLLRRAGYAVSGLFMKNWEEDDREGHCAAALDLDDARRVSARLGIELGTANFSDTYWEQVFQHFLRELEAGRTPNPDVLCNREVKFRAFLDHALSLGARRIATGHYARVRYQDGAWQLLKGLDRDKDQSYFLYMLGPRALAHTLFPLGELTKQEVRRLAREAGLATHAKGDSTGICFIGERNFAPFLARYLDPSPGPMTTPEGEVVGPHRGLPFYTIGQRQGLGLGGTRGGSGEPWYVVAKDRAANRLVVAQGHDHPWLLSTGLEADQLHWVAGRAPALPLRCRAKTRYRQSDQRCLVDAAGDGIRVRFDAPQWAVTPGQSVVFYAGDICLGGGIIQRTLGSPISGKPP